MSPIHPLPLILAGPILRAVNRQQLCIWMITSTQQPIEISLFDEQLQSLHTAILGAEQLKRVQVGERAYVTLIDFQWDLKPEQRYYYNLSIQQGKEQKDLTQLMPDLLYSGEPMPHFYVPEQLNNVLHGSCRKPHHPVDDGLVCADQQIAKSLAQQASRPDILLMTGDQIYADDVAGPTLNAIHQVIALLGLYQESFDNPQLPDSQSLHNNPESYYNREQLLPDVDDDSALQKVFIKGKKKPVFTSVNAKNHLMSLAEIMAMYMLVWSPELWAKISLHQPNLADEYSEIYQKERQTIEDFIAQLANVRRCLAHIPCYMIFDDHDVTDDWNLTRGWEEAVYNNPFSKRIIGNALIGYWLCQGWGNRPQVFEPIIGDQQLIEQRCIVDQDKLIGALLNWDQWHYQLNTNPPIMVLDTRTQRWRSESKLNKPSGLMDWESLCELQQQLIGKESVIMVSAAPIYGVKLIETIQRIFTFFGKALMVDAENWMAHKGTASVILNIFRHIKTPPNFIILSGDVHYSFVYDVSLRFRRNSPHIMQFTASGIKNTFPDGLLRWFDRLNQVFYARYSPLNWLTQRRYMSIHQRRPRKLPHRTLLNQSGLGQLLLTDDQQPVVTRILSPNQPDRDFAPKAKEPKHPK